MVRATMSHRVLASTGAFLFSQEVHQYTLWGILYLDYKNVWYKHRYLYNYMDTKLIFTQTSPLHVGFNV